MDRSPGVAVSLEDRHRPLARSLGCGDPGADYYLANVANSVDDYYLGRGEAPGPVDRCHIGWPSTSPASWILAVLRNLLDGRGGGG